jgi:hypothetical protein
MSKPGGKPGLLERRQVKKKNYITSLVYHVLTKQFKQKFNGDISSYFFSISYYLFMLNLAFRDALVDTILTGGIG